MAKINENFLKLQGGYLFSEIAHRVSEFQKENPDKTVMKLGIGDVTRPLPKAVVTAMQSAVSEMGESSTFRGYGPDFGYDFLRKVIAENDFTARGADISFDEIFISDGAKSDTGNIGDIFSTDNIIAVCDPVYPVYVDTNVMAGRAGEFTGYGRYSNIVYIPCTEQNDFCPMPIDEHADIVYLCFPNNPTGVMATKEMLIEWVKYAKEHNAIIFYDAAYEAFITEDLPHSIYEIEGAKDCAIEFRSFSKTAGFTGARCAFTVIPKQLKVKTEDGTPVSLHSLWARRQGTKFNGVSYITQRGAEAVYSEDGKKQVAENINYYLDNAKIIFDGLTKAGFKCRGGKNSPYVWVKSNGGMGSWEFFDLILKKCCVVTTPGEGFGMCGEGYIRLSALGDKEVTKKAVKAIADEFGNK